jgi:hypothetical protein
MRVGWRDGGEGDTYTDDGRVPVDQDSEVEWRREEQEEETEDAAVFKDVGRPKERRARDGRRRLVSSSEPTQGKGSNVSSAVLEAAAGDGMGDAEMAAGGNIDAIVCEIRWPVSPTTHAKDALT